MKARDFAYARPRDLAEALELLGSLGDTGVPLAGGQSLLAAMNMRLASPRVLVDIGGLAECRGIRREGDAVIIGALTTHSEVLGSDIIRAAVPLLEKSARHIAHVAIRNRGTIGGSLAYADPAAELPACVVALNATIRVATSGGVRAVPADQFFRGLFQTDLSAGELILEIACPVQRTHQIAIFGELSRRQGDFALVALAGILATTDHRITGARLAYAGCADHVALARHVSDHLIGQALPLSSMDWLPTALAADLQIHDSPGLRGRTRLHLATTLTERLLGNLT
jgi:carbon-monoxide dehydrogenase medium subunit